jgi:hypothetical protein
MEEVAGKPREPLAAQGNRMNLINLIAVRLSRDYRISAEG